ncbi:MAG TPA: CheR family methyltransferase, partial [Kofleriaceae bacterium]|nr:CheR family methyltransferase [Kofleriaceae bacterium]
MNPGGVDMTTEEFRLLRDLIHRYAGIYFGDDKAYLIKRRLAPRLEVTGARTFGEYARLLRFGARGRRELEEAIDRVAVNETYFFREEYQLRAFGDEILPRLRADSARDRALSIWSAGCSSGEEAYTISMLILEHGGFRDWDLRIVGTDISRKILRQASQGLYRDSALRQTSALRRDRFFRRAGTHWELRPEVRAPVAFARLNLLEEEPLELVDQVDVLF